MAYVGGFVPNYGGGGYPGVGQFQPQGGFPGFGGPGQAYGPGPSYQVGNSQQNFLGGQLNALDRTHQGWGQFQNPGFQGPPPFNRGFEGPGGPGGFPGGPGGFPGQGGFGGPHGPGFGPQSPQAQADHQALNTALTSAGTTPQAFFQGVQQQLAQSGQQPSPANFQAAVQSQLASPAPAP